MKTSAVRIRPVPTSYEVSPVALVSELSAAGHRLAPVIVESGHLLAHMDWLAQRLLILVSGRALLLCGSGGPALAILERGAVFGAGLVPARRAHVRAVGHTVAWCLPAGGLSDALATHPGLRLAVYRTQEDVLAQTCDAMEMTAYGLLVSRLARLLLQLADSGGEIIGFTHALLGEALGTHRESATPRLIALREAGIIDQPHHRHLVIRDRAALAAVAEGVTTVRYHLWEVSRE